VLIKEAGGYVVVSVGEDGGGDSYRVPKEPAYRVAAAIDLGLDFFDDDAATAFCGFHGVFISP
jgi:hypothetical protein